MEDIIKEIEEYTPFNESEERDREVILWFLKSNPNAFDRENTIAHMSASCWIVNPRMDKVLMCYHKIYKSWSWLGGHADNDKDLFHVALKEAKEESGLKNIRPYDKKIFSVEILPVNGHVKKGKYVSSHIHLNVTYLFTADEEDALTVSPEENTGLKWFDITDVMNHVSEPWMNEYVYSKLIQKTTEICKNQVNK